jgi:murein L,D-transpeptidase YcbB/YkuD
MFRWHPPVWVAAILFFLGLGGSAFGEPSIPPRLNPSAAFAVDGIAIDVPLVTTFYAARNSEAVWLGNPKRTELAERVLSFLGEADREGLDPTDYAIVPLAKRLAASGSVSQETELLLTHAVLRYISDIQAGRVAPRKFDPSLFVTPRLVDAPRILAEALAAKDPVSYLSSLSPPYPEYRRLKRALAEYRSIKEHGGFTPVPPGAALKAGSQGARVRALRQRLHEEAYLAEATGSTFDHAVAAAVRDFQANHGLEGDGVAGKQTLRKMNETVEHHIHDLILNLERWRWLDEDLGRRHVRVNIADFTVRAHEGTREVLRMKAIVGKPARMTPIFSSVITDVLFQPYWYVPERLAREDILPKLYSNPTFLVQERFAVYRWSGKTLVKVAEPVDWTTVDGNAPFPFVLRQEAGPQNALGPIKFNITNTWDIYLHGTPAQHLFQSTERAYSSGCIRLEDPLALAKFLFAYDPKISAERLDALYYSAVNEPPSQPVNVRLSEPVPVHIVYWTAWADPDGRVHFVDDVYGRDALLAKALGL